MPFFINTIYPKGLLCCLSYFLVAIRKLRHPISFYKMQRWAKPKFACRDWKRDFANTSLNIETESDSFYIQAQSLILRLRLLLISLTVWDRVFILGVLVSKVETETLVSNFETWDWEMFRTFVCSTMSVRHFQETIIKILWSTFLLRPWLSLYWCSLIFDTETETFGLCSQTARLILRLLICGFKHWD